MSALNPVVDDADPDRKASSQLFDGKFLWSFEYGRRNFVAVADPFDHALGECLACGAAQLLLIERRSNLLVSPGGGQSRDLSEDGFAITKSLRHGQGEIDTEILKRAALLANVQQGFSFVAAFFDCYVLD